MNAVTERAAYVLAGNPGPMTLEGTNTWLLREPASDTVVIVDPGPDDDAHVRAVQEQAESDGRRVALILLTHAHPDHAGGARKMAEAVRAPVLALDPRQRLGEEGLAHGDVVAVDGLEVRVVSTPGHSSDSVCFHLPADDALLSGDTILGRGTTVVAHPDGRLADYLESLQRLRAVAAEAGASTLLPGHGPVQRDLVGVIDFYIAHRAERLAEVESAVAAGLQTPREIVERVYADVDRAVWPAAELSVRAQLDYLRERGALP